MPDFWLHMQCSAQDHIHHTVKAIYICCSNKETWYPWVHNTTDYQFMIPDDCPDHIRSVASTYHRFFFQWLWCDRKCCQQPPLLHSAHHLSQYPSSPGNLYTVVLQYAETGAGESVAGGRVAKTHFPIESWPKSHECPFPTVNDDNYKVRGGI